MNRRNHEGHSHFKKGQFYFEKDQESFNQEESNSDRSQYDRRDELSPTSSKLEIDPGLHGRHNEESPDQQDVFGIDPGVNQPTVGG